MTETKAKEHSYTGVAFEITARGDSDKSVEVTKCEETRYLIDAKPLLEARSVVGKTIATFGRQWDTVSSRYEPSYHILKAVNSTYGYPSRVSNAYLKARELYEFVGADMFPHGIGHFDNASLPGDFIRAARDFATIHGLAYSWRACSYTGSKDALGDRFGLYRDNRDKWIMTSTMNGDLTNPDNVRTMGRAYGSSCTGVELKSPHTEDPASAAAQSPHTKPWGCRGVTCAERTEPPCLYTSDLGFHFNYDTLEEDQQFPGHAGQIAAGLLMLGEGGVLIVKGFTMLRCRTRYVVRILSSVFRRTWIYKPQTSKADNSESYIVCVGYTAESGHTVAEELIGMMSDSSETADGKHCDCHSHVGKSIAEASATLVSRQTAKINSNIGMFNKKEMPDPYSNTVTTMRWIKRYPPAASRTLVRRSAASRTSPGMKAEHSEKTSDLGP